MCFRDYNLRKRKQTLDMAESEATVVYAVINNIPSDYHSADLRNYFSQFIETRGFQCFHFRHRPELQKPTKCLDGVSSDENNSSRVKTFCCVVQVKETRVSELIKMYHRKHWLDRRGDIIPSFCYISQIFTSDTQSVDLQATPLSESAFESSKYMTRWEQRKIPENREQFTKEDLQRLPELHPPDIMPNGNVGTPTMIFMEYIKQCRMPPSVIRKLGLSFPRMRTNKKYGNVPFDYGGATEVHEGDEEEEEVLTGSGHVIQGEQANKNIEAAGGTDSSVQTDKEPDVHSDAVDNNKNTATGSVDKDLSHSRQRKKKPKMDAEARRRMKLNIEEKMIHDSSSGSGEDNDSCEEWERHEALYDDPSNQERNKERLFEEKIELKWEKGGSGLVFYTDAQYWQAQEGDFDEQTADDWDVDMSIYYEKGAGDKDARDYIAMRQEQLRRDGVEATDRYTAGIARKRGKRMAAEASHRIGKFEEHSKGVGRKIMERQGWTEGEGLGSTIKGISDALENEGQNPTDKSGFGYRGEKLVRYSMKKPRTADKEVIISTKYDNPSDTDPPEPLLRRHEPYHITYRHKVDFQPEKDTKD